MKSYKITSDPQSDPMLSLWLSPKCSEAKPSALVTMQRAGGDPTSGGGEKSHPDIWGVLGVPPNGGFIRENPAKMNDLVHRMVETFTTNYHPINPIPLS